MTASCPAARKPAGGRGSPVGGRGPPEPVTPPAGAADLLVMTAVQTLIPTTFVAARGRAHGPTVALWHAVELHRPEAELDGACELIVCGSLAPVATEAPWARAARGRLPRPP